MRTEVVEACAKRGIPAERGETPYES